MKHALFAWVLAAMLAVPQGSAAAELAVGDVAPDFSLEGSDGKTHRLRDLLAEGGPRGIVLAWFPMAFTPG